MRSIKTLAAAMAVGGLLLLAPASAQETCVPSVGRDNALGTSRTVEIDTSKGPLYGFQYKDQNFLNDGEVVLTFDDGPLRSYTVPVLEALAAHCTKATFFVVGRMAVADPEMVKEYDRRGHTIGTHTWSHVNLRAASPARARAEIELGFSAVQKALGKPIAPFFRFPFLADPPGMIAHLKERQIGIFSIDVDSKDFRTRDPVTVHRRVMGDVARPRKGIILFHDIQPSTARALPGLLADLKAKGYREGRRRDGRRVRRAGAAGARPQANRSLGAAARQARPYLAGGHGRAQRGRVGQARSRRRQGARSCCAAAQARPAPEAGGELASLQAAVLVGLQLATKLRIRR